MKREIGSVSAVGRGYAAIRIVRHGVIAVLVAVASAEAGTLTVTNTNDSGSNSLRDRIAAAASGDTITFSLPVNSTVTLTTAELVINKNLTIDGGAGKIVIARSSASGTPDFRVFNITSGAVTLTNLTISNGLLEPGQGGGIYNAGSLTLSKVTINDNVVQGGGVPRGAGIYNVGTLNIDRTTMTNNRAQGVSILGEGGGIYNDSGATLTLTNSTLYNNYGTGTAVLNNGTAHVRNTILARGFAGPRDVVGNFISDGYNLVGTIDTSTSSGFGAAGSHDRVGVIGAQVSLGPLQDNGGSTKTMAPLVDSIAIDQGDSGGATTDQRASARPIDNPGVPNAGDGSDIGAVESDFVNFVVTTVDEHSDGVCGTDCSLRDAVDAANANAANNSVITFAPGVQGTIPNTLLKNGINITRAVRIAGPGTNVLSVSGGGANRVFSVNGTFNAIITGLTITNGNESTDFGGDIYSNATLALDRVVVSDGSAGFAGGGIRNDAGTLTVSNSTLSNNSAGIGGAAILNSGKLTIINSTLSGNMAKGGSGGAIAGGDATLINTTLSGNSATGGGGAITAGSTLVLTNSTISGNSAQDGGGVYNANGGTVTATNTIIALNTASNTAPDVSGSLFSQGFNLIGNNSGASISFQKPTDQIGTPGATIDPLLGPLQDNGGPTFTQALLTGSPAIDKGNSSGSATDQRGLPRPSDDPAIAPPTGGDNSDIGAFELQTVTATPTPTPTVTPNPPTPTPSPTPPSQLLNLSTRKLVGAGDNVLIGGFIVVGSQDKQVLVRGLGPSLPVSGALENPTLEIHSADTTLLAANNDWKETQEAEINATGIPPSNDLESAVVINLAAKPAADGGAGYTAILAGSGGGTGIGLLEIYDLATAANSKLANISTRGFVGTGDDLLIGGFIPGPAERLPVKVLIRALGPSLGAQAVSDTLQDPVLELHDANGTLVMNDNWKDAANAAEIQATLPPPDDREAAIITTLAPTNSGYTAIVRGANDTTGVALVEVYALE